MAKQLTLEAGSISQLKELRSVTEEAVKNCQNLEARIAKDKEALAKEQASLAEAKASMEAVVKGLPKEIQELAAFFLSNGTPTKTRKKRRQVSSPRMTFEEKMDFVRSLVEKAGGELSLTEINKAYVEKTNRQSGPLKRDIENCTWFKINGTGRDQIVKLV